MERNLELSVLTKAWRGGYPLSVMFWVFYVGGYAVSVILTLIISPLFQVQPWRAISVLILIVPYNVFSTIGTLRSVSTHPFMRFWSTAAKICIVLWEARIMWSLDQNMARAVMEML